MSDFIERMQNEYDELALKIEKLLNFIETDDYDNLAANEKQLLAKQCNHMLAYIKVLDQRITLAKNNLH